jgi:MFS family permease
VIPEPRRGLAGAPPTAAGSWGDVFRFMQARWAFFACHLIGFSAIMAMAYAQMSWTPAFLIRRFGWEVDQVGVTLGSFGLVMGLFTFLTTGALVDWLMKKGMLDAHFRYYLWGSIAALVAGALCFLSPTPTPFFAGLAIIAIPCNMAAIAASAIQLVTPAGLRGRVSAVYLMVVALFAMTVGPSMVGLLTDDVFKDPQKIHLSLSVTYAILSPIAIAAFAFGLGPMRQAVRRADETA